MLRAFRLCWVPIRGLAGESERAEAGQVEGCGEQGEVDGDLGCYPDAGARPAVLAACQGAIFRSTVGLVWV